MIKWFFELYQDWMKLRIMARLRDVLDSYGIEAFEYSLILEGFEQVVLCGGDVYYHKGNVAYTVVVGKKYVVENKRRCFMTLDVKRARDRLADRVEELNRLPLRAFAAAVREGRYTDEFYAHPNGALIERLRQLSQNFGEPRLISIIEEVSLGLYNPGPEEKFDVLYTEEAENWLRTIGLEEAIKQGIPQNILKQVWPVVFNKKWELPNREEYSFMPNHDIYPEPEFPK